jgi:hypothetical protein
VHVLTWEKPSINWLKCNIDGTIYFLDRREIRYWYMLSLQLGFLCPSTYYDLSLCSYCCWMWSLHKCSRVRFVYSLWERYIPKVIVNSLWMFCVMTVCMRMNLTLCFQLAVPFSILMLINYNITYVRRQVNRVVRNLARTSLFHSNSSFLHYVPPNYISSIILNEMQWVHFDSKNIWNIYSHDSNWFYIS